MMESTPQDRIRRAIVIGLEQACTLLDAIPVPYRKDNGGWGVSGGAIGCYWLHLSSRSADLDEKWNTGVWKETPHDS